MRYVSLVATVFLVCLLRAARGDYLPESAFHECAQIVRMRVTEAVLTKWSETEGVQLWGLKIVGKVLETIKGESTDDVLIYTSVADDERLKVRVGDELLYLRPQGGIDSMGLEPILLQIGGGGTSLISRARVVDHSFKALAAADLLERLREMGKKSNGPLRVFNIGYSFYGTDAALPPQMSLVEGPALALLVEEWSRSENPLVRSFAVQAMEKVVWAGREALLRSLLRDPWNVEQTVFESAWRPNIYPIRLEARAQLLKLGVPEDELPLELAESLNVRYSPVRIGWILTAVGAMGIGGLVGMRKVSGSWGVAAKRSVVAVLVAMSFF